MKRERAVGALLHPRPCLSACEGWSGRSVVLCVREEARVFDLETRICWVRDDWCFEGTETFD